MPRRAANEKDLVAFDLKADRKKRELSQEQAAEIMCASQASVARWEASGQCPAVYRKAWVQHWKLKDQEEKEKEVDKSVDKVVTKAKKAAKEKVA